MLIDRDDDVVDYKLHALMQLSRSYISVTITDRWSLSPLDPSLLADRSALSPANSASDRACTSLSGTAGMIDLVNSA